MALKECNAPKWSSVYDRLKGQAADTVCGARFRLTQPDQTECPKCGGRTKVEVLADQTIKVSWTGPKKRGSLFQICASGNVDAVNKLDKIELWSVFSAVRECPFPMGDYAPIYRTVLKSYRETGLSEEQDKASSLGELRAHMLKKAGEGINAPTDSYLRAAAEVHDADPTPVDLRQLALFGQS